MKKSKNLVIYHCNDYSKEKFLFSLCEKILKQKDKLVILCSEENINLLDKQMWTFASEKFIPHGCKYDDTYKDLQSVYITDDQLDNPSGSDNILCYDNYCATLFNHYTKVISFNEDKPLANQNIDIIRYEYKNNSWSNI